MVDGFGLSALPRVGHRGLYRDHETLEPVSTLLNYHQDIQEHGVFGVVDPMLATGETSNCCVKTASDEKYGVKPESIPFAI